jgi:hypothetical protein
MVALNERQYKAAALGGGGLTPLGYQQITSLSSAAGLTVPAGATVAVVQAEDQNVRWRDDGTAPTASVGMYLVADDWFAYTGDLSTVEFIEEAVSAKLNVSYY